MPLSIKLLNTSRKAFLLALTGDKLGGISALKSRSLSWAIACAETSKGSKISLTTTDSKLRVLPGRRIEEVDSGEAAGKDKGAVSKHHRRRISCH